MTETKISFGNYELDKFFEGGYENDIITTIYGPAGCGKTNLCMLATVSQTKQGKKVIFMDTEGGFSVDRFKQIAEGDYDTLSDKVLLLKPTSFDEQKKAFEILSKELNKTPIGLIIVDGMTMLYRLELSKDKDENKIYDINKELARQMRILAEISRKKNIPVIVTNQIYYSFQNEEEWKGGKEKIVNLVGGDILKYWSKCLIEIKNIHGKRALILKKHRSLPEKELQFIITNQGIKKRGLF